MADTVNEVGEKDATEIELENLIFGNDNAFYEGLRSHEDANRILSLKPSEDVERSERSSEDEGMHDVDDADVDSTFQLQTPS